MNKAIMGQLTRYYVRPLKKASRMTLKDADIIRAVAYQINIVHHQQALPHPEKEMGIKIAR